MSKSEHYANGSSGRGQIAPNSKPPKIVKLPTRLNVKCPACRHQAVIFLRLENVAKLKCSRCGDRHPIVQGREPLRTWSRYRR